MIKSTKKEEKWTSEQVGQLSFGLSSQSWPALFPIRHAADSTGQSSKLVKRRYQKMNDRFDKKIVDSHD